METTQNVYSFVQAASIIKTHGGTMRKIEWDDTKFLFVKHVDAVIDQYGRQVTQRMMLSDMGVETPEIKVNEFNKEEWVINDEENIKGYTYDEISEQMGYGNKAMRRAWGNRRYINSEGLVFDYVKGKATATLYLFPDEDIKADDWYVHISPAIND